MQEVFVNCIEEFVNSLRIDLISRKPKIGNLRPEEETPLLSPHLSATKWGEIRSGNTAQKKPGSRREPGFYEKADLLFVNGDNRVGRVVDRIDCIDISERSGR